MANPIRISELSPRYCKNNKDKQSSLPISQKNWELMIKAKYGTAMEILKNF